MNDEELEKQTQLWHTKVLLQPEKTETLRKALTDALPQAHRRRRWQVGGLAALALTSVPLGGALIVSLSTDPLVAQTRIEALSLPAGKILVDGLLLAADGTIAGECARNVGGEGIGAPRAEREYLVWPPHSTAPEPLRPAEGRVSQISDFLPSGELGVSIHYPNQTGRFALWKEGRWRFLCPLPGYEYSAPPSHVLITPQGIVGLSLKFPTKRGAVWPSKPTLWRGETPEPLPEGLLPTTANLFASSPKGDLMVIRSNEGALQLYANGKRTAIVPSEGRDSHGALLWKATPRGIGGNQVIVGELEREGEETTIALWTSPSAPPRPLWEKSSPLSPLPLRYSDIDAEGKVVGELQDPLTGAVTPFIWKDGRYRDLQTLLPRSSDWKLQGAMRVAGRTVVGMGQYRGQPATYRLTLPPNFP